MTLSEFERQKLEFQIAEILDKYGVRNVYRAERRGVYAVWKVGTPDKRAVQVTEPTTHAGARQDYRELVAREIADLLENRNE